MFRFVRQFFSQLSQFFGRICCCFRGRPQQSDTFFETGEVLNDDVQLTSIVSAHDLYFDSDNHLVDQLIEALTGGDEDRRPSVIIRL